MSTAAFVVEYALADRPAGTCSSTRPGLPGRPAAQRGRPHAGLLLAPAAAPLAGRLSDRVGRRPLLVGGAVALLVLTVPATVFVLGGDPDGLLLGFSLIGPALGMLVPSTFLAELFPTRLRSRDFSPVVGDAGPPAACEGCPDRASAAAGPAGRPGSTRRRHRQ